MTPHTHADLLRAIAARIAEHEAKERTRVEAERERIRAEEQAKAEAAARAAATTPAPAPVPPTLTPAPELRSVSTGTPAANEPPAGADTGARMTLGQINARIAPLSITVAGLDALGFQHVGKEKAAFLFRAADFGAICDALAHRAMQAKADHAQRLAA